jgi:hypothetical protein
MSAAHRVSSRLRRQAYWPVLRLAVLFTSHMSRSRIAWASTVTRACKLFYADHADCPVKTFAVTTVQQKQSAFVQAVSGPNAW